VGQELTARARADNYWRASFDEIGPLLSIGWTIAGVALWLAALALSMSAPQSHPLFVVVVAGLVSMLTLAFAVGRIAVANDLFGRMRALPELDLAGASVDDLLAIPSGMLSPQHAVSVSHLDRILRGGADLNHSQLRSLRRLNVQAITIGLSVVVALLAFLLCAATLLALVTSTRTFGEAGAWQLFGMMAIGPVAINAVVLWAFQQLGLIEVARRFVLAQQILDRGVLPDDGSPLTVLVRRGGRTVVNPRALPSRRAPRQRHFLAATTGKIPALLAQAWAFAALGLVVTILAVVRTLTARA
jgi:hypothetical protein